MSSHPTTISVGVDNRQTPVSPLFFSALPDPVGFAGNFAAGIGDRLITGGGSQFPDKPLWLDGQKAYSDRIFVLDRPDGTWVELQGRLPQPMAHFAFAATTDTVYLAGGIGYEGASSQVVAISFRGDSVESSSLPDLPRPLVYGTATVAGGRLYVAGGQHDVAVKSATSECWSLDLASPDSGWQREPDLPGTGTFVGAMASDGATLYFLGGVGFDENGKGVQSAKASRFQPGAAAWDSLPDLPEPRVGAVTPCPIIDGRRIFVMGGYASAFAGERRDHPGFSAQTFLYDLTTRQWSHGPVLPHEKPADKDATSDAGPAPMVAAPGTVWRDCFVAVGGEVRASVRTPAVVAYPLSSL